ncbi:MAG: hypothetical protein PHV33_00245 [Elusimicrobiales bacterium]|nr:hypothetical protein [Elusimicrobiales bacterium]
MTTTPVRPKKWTNIIDLYDDGKYSAIWGNYDGDKKRCLGVRWNGDKDKCGYPSQGGNPLWYVEPDFLTKDILFSLLYKAIQNKTAAQQKNVLTALSEIDT